MPKRSTSKIAFVLAITSRSQALSPVDTSRTCKERKNGRFTFAISGGAVKRLQSISSSRVFTDIRVDRSGVMVPEGHIRTQALQPRQRPLSSVITLSEMEIARIGHTSMHFLHEFPSHGADESAGKPHASSVKSGNSSRWVIMPVFKMDISGLFMDFFLLKVISAIG
jgi:hypothetical protein